MQSSASRAALRPGARPSRLAVLGVLVVGALLLRPNTSPAAPGRFVPARTVRPTGSLARFADAPRWAQKNARRAAPAKPRMLTPAQAERFMARVARRENGFYQPGVGVDARTGLTYDGVNIDFRTGKVLSHRNWSAPSKESLHVALLVKALAGDSTAQTMISPDPARPELAKDQALKLLARKIAAYERFNRDYPGFGGFLPWFRVQGGKLEPMPTVVERKPDGSTARHEGWETRVPSLDNGQLAWSLYYAVGQLEALGEKDLARRYRKHLSLMERNVVRMFYDPDRKQMRAEASMARGNRVAPDKNRYAVNAGNAYFLEDSYEGLMLCHFADLFGDWGESRAGKEAIWCNPRRKPGTFVSPKGERITVAKAWIGSSHEEWGDQILPFADVPLHAELLENAQRARTAFSAQKGIPGLFASTHRPLRRGGSPHYASMLGFSGGDSTIDTNPRRSDIVTPYAAFPLALVRGGKPLFATWLKTMISGPRMFGPLGIGESSNTSGSAIAPCLTWDGKALPMLAWMGGIRDEIRGQLIKDGKYEPFLKRVQADYRLFRGLKVEGTAVPMRAPTRAIPPALSDFAPGDRAPKTAGAARR